MTPSPLMTPEEFIDRERRKQILHPWQNTILDALEGDSPWPKRGPRNEWLKIGLDPATGRDTSTMMVAEFKGGKLAGWVERVEPFTADEVRRAVLQAMPPAHLTGYRRTPLLRFSVEGLR